MDKKVTASGDTQLTHLEVEAIVEQKISPLKESINPSSAPYLSVTHFLWAMGILVTILSSLLGYVWKKMNDNNASINSRVTHSNDRIHERIDDGNKEIEQTEDKLRSEFNHKIDKLDEKIWEITLRTDLKVGDIVVLDKNQKTN